MNKLDLKELTTEIEETPYDWIVLDKSEARDLIKLANQALDVQMRSDAADRDRVERQQREIERLFQR